MPEDKNLNSEPKIEPKLEKPITDQEKISVSETEKQEKIDQGLEKISQKGEKTARTINTMIETGKVHAKKIIELIRKWLSIVPGINKFFVEQQAKIKTDKIMQIKKE